MYSSHKLVTHVLEATRAYYLTFVSPQTVINAVAIVNFLQSWPEPVIAEDGSEYVTMNKLKRCLYL